MCTFDHLFVQLPTELVLGRLFALHSFLTQSKHFSAVHSLVVLSVQGIFEIFVSYLNSY